ncbi:phospholipid carrier-dependent glycosyltransferase [Saccharopolyspora sp. HNM0983]|uniref:Phospholipid carrier-dependent glycosyltransferase n=1 Tax=Saccharopolyspora montiporae TaxID=2781240 RepID=A0A929BA08_9PSEU|nr:phospholipid carrier-dependent glycosyltransferase [Saccharopolyspora sp. HNM0983]MBE9376037.1 phospholipid carrier-dependent glycosyltransferase [Saccharopolyspora sp. HNM0983]
MLAGLRRHWVLTVVLVGGIVLRAAAQVAYRPALLYFDSYWYLENLEALSPTENNPIGYQLLLLKALVPFGGLASVALVQHVLVIGMAVAAYVLLLRWGTRPWIAGMASAPLLLDGYQVQIEQLIMSDVLFQALIFCVVFALLWSTEPGPWRSLLAGVFLGCAVIVRLPGIVLVVPAVLFVVFAVRAGREIWRHRLLSACSLLLGFAVVLGSYASYHHAWTGEFALGGSKGGNVLMFGRAAMVADCGSLPLTSDERLVCPEMTHEERVRFGIDTFIHHYPRAGTVPPEVDVEEVKGSFIRKVFLNQPGEVLGAVATDFLKGFAPTRVQAAGDVPLERWKFQETYPMYAGQTYVLGILDEFDDGGYAVDERLASALRLYQSTVGYTSGTALGAALLIAVLAGAGPRGSRRLSTGRAALLPATMAVSVLGASAAVEFSWRYQLPGLVLIPLAGALGVTALMCGRADGAAGSRSAAPESDRRAGLAVPE